MAKIEFTCEEEMKDDIKVEAKKLGLSVASFVRLAIIEKVRKDNR